MKALKILGAIALAVLIPGGIVLGVSAYMLTKICYKPVDFAILSADIKTIKCELVMRVKNPSMISVGVSGYDFDVFINGIKIARLVNKDKAVLEKGSVSVVTIPITVALDKIIDFAKSSELLALLLTRNMSKIIVSLKGSFKGDVSGFPISTSVDFKYSVAEIKKLAAEPSMPCDV